MSRDRYRDILGGRVRVIGFDEVVRLVREDWPDAYAEGSMGPERTWWVRGEDEIVAHSVPIGRSDAYWLRMRRPTQASSPA